MEKKGKIMVAMSGGVDSSVAAAILVEEGYDVIGGYMKNWSGSIKVPQSDGGFECHECDWRVERRDAMRVASQLGIVLKTYDFEKEYRARVYEYMIAEYEAGRTPNPDVMCNIEVKFDLLMKAALEEGCEFLVTGHYARVLHGEINRLYKGVDGGKDQSYFLCRLGQTELEQAMFPVGELEKSEVRVRARALGLATADKKDSQGLCFVGKVDMPTFLKERITVNRGDIVTVDGEVIGQHDGVQFYTIGQRRGIGVGGGPALFVVERRMETNELVVAPEGSPELFSSEAIVGDLSWVSGVAPEMGRFRVKTRYRQADQWCEVFNIGGGRLRVVFDEKQRSLAPGQFVVFYDGEEVDGGEELIGSGVLEAALM